MMRRLLIISVTLLACACSGAQVKHYRPKVLQEYVHDASAYTQGLFFHQDTLYETTGQYGESSLRKVDLQSGNPYSVHRFSSKYFIEGSVVLNDVLYILTWTNRVAFRYDAGSLSYIKTLSYPREGWGLTTDGRRLIASDGSAWLYFLDEDMKVEKKLQVKLDGKPLRNLNELEWIKGKIWANVYLTDMIAIIDPDSGKVEATLDCSNLLPAKLRTRETDVLNGIAADNKGNIYITGKNWPRMYRIELVKR